MPVGKNAVHRRLHPRLRPVHPPTVVFPTGGARPGPGLTWDASRGTGGDVSSSSSAAARIAASPGAAVGQRAARHAARAARVARRLGRRRAARGAMAASVPGGRARRAGRAARSPRARVHLSEHRTEPKYAERARRLRQTRMLGWARLHRRVRAIGPEDSPSASPFVLSARRSRRRTRARGGLPLPDELQPAELTPGVAVHHVAAAGCVVQVFDGLSPPPRGAHRRPRLVRVQPRRAADARVARGTPRRRRPVEIDPGQARRRMLRGVLASLEFVLHSACVPTVQLLGAGGLFPKCLEQRGLGTCSAARSAAGRCCVSRSRTHGTAGPARRAARPGDDPRAAGGMARLHAADALEEKLRELRPPPTPPPRHAAAATRRRRRRRPSRRRPPRRSDPHRRAAAPRRRRTAGGGGARRRRGCRGARLASGAARLQSGAGRRAAGQVEATARRRLGRPAQGHADPARGRRVRRGEACARGAPPRAARRARRPSPSRVRGATLRAVRHRPDVGALRGAHRPTRRNVD